MGRHVLMDIEQADPALLNDPQYLTDLMESAAAFIGVTVLHTHSHQFSPQGVTAFVMLAESHMSIHTWPESGDAALDVFTCGEADPREAADFIMTGLGGWVQPPRGAQFTGIANCRHCATKLLPPSINL